LGREGIGIDISEKYYQIAEARLGTIEAELEEGGEEIQGEAAE